MSVSSRLLGFLARSQERGHWVGRKNVVAASTVFCVNLWRNCPFFGSWTIVLISRGERIPFCSSICRNTRNMVAQTDYDDLVSHLRQLGLASGDAVVVHAKLISSDFEAIHDFGLKTLFLGCLFSEACTYLHHVEAMVEIPYRRWIVIPKKRLIAETGEIKTVPLNYFARNNLRWEENFDCVTLGFREAQIFSEAPAPYGQSFLVDTHKMDLVSREMLKHNPYALVSGVENRELH